MSTTQRNTIFFLAFLMVFVVAISYFFFLPQSLRLDESQSLWQTSRPPLSIFYVVAQDVHPPLYHQFLFFWRLFIDNSVTGARLASLFFYVLSIPALYLLGKKAYSRKAGLWAALLFAVSPFMNWYGNETRMYALLTFLTIVNQYYYLDLWRNRGMEKVSPNEKDTVLDLTQPQTKRKTDAWFWYAVTAILGVFTQYFFFLVLVVQALFYFLRRPLFEKTALRNFIITAVLVVLSIAPWLFYVIHLNEVGYQTPVLSVPSSVDLFSAFEQFLIGFQDNTLSTVFLSLWPLALAFGFLALQRHKRIATETEYFLLAVFAPVLIAFGVSYVISPVFVSRYLIITVPALFLCLISLFDAFPRRFSLFCKVALVVLMLVAMGNEIFSAYTPVKEDYEQAAAYLSSHARPQDAVIVSAPFTIYPIEYYYTGSAPVTTLPIWDQYGNGAIPAFSEAALPQEVASTTAGVQDVWLLLSYDQGYQKNIQQYFDSHYQRLYTKTFSPDLIVEVYQIRYDAPLSSATVNFQ